MSFDATIERVLDLLINPDWASIKEAESQDLHRAIRYLVSRVGPVIALNAGAYFVGVTLVGSRGYGATNFLPMFVAILASLLLAATYVGAIYLGALVVRLIASSFDSMADEIVALKLVAFAFYPLLVLGSLHVIPGMKIGMLAGMYGAYLLYNGMPIMLGTPVEKSANFAMVVTLAVMGILAPAFALINTVSGAGMALRIGF